MMRKILLRILDHSSSDRGDGNLISAFLVLPLFVFLGLMSVDAGMFFYNNSQIQNVARDGAYSVASVAGTGDDNTISNLEDSFFREFTPITRSDLDSGGPSSWHDAGGRSLNPTNSMEYLLMDTLGRSNLYNVDITGVNCGVQSGDSMSNWVHSMNDRPYCRIDWQHSWLGVSFLGVFVDHSERSTTVNVPAEVIIGSDIPSNTTARSS